MTLDTITPDELKMLWGWMHEEPEFHIVDETPALFDEWTERLAIQGIDVIAVRTGKKFVGAIGFQPSTGMIRGVHFRKEVRGSGFARKALQALLASLFLAGAQTVSLRYLSTNMRAHRFFRRCGAEFNGIDGNTTQGGLNVPLLRATFHAGMFCEA